MEKWHLRKTKQCAKCPWKVSTDPYDIPNGYDVEAHAALAGTIAAPGQMNVGSQRAMACHESPSGAENYCIGWLDNQLGVGNNIGLRIQFSSCANAGDIQVDGEQHECFEDTLPFAW